MPVHTPKEVLRWERRHVTVINETDEYLTEEFDGERYAFPPKSFDETIPQGIATIWFGDYRDRENKESWNLEVRALQERNAKTWPHKQAGKFRVQQWGMAPGHYRLPKVEKEVVNAARPLSELTDDDRKALAELGLNPVLPPEPAKAAAQSPAPVDDDLLGDSFNADDYEAVLAESDDEDDSPKGKRGKGR